MYLSDRDIMALLPQLEIQVEGGFPGFDPETQVATCSIDLRLGSAFWRPRARKIPLDLRKPRLFELRPSSYYAKESLAEGQVTTIGPGQLLLARTLERFAVPDGYMFDLIGRSSFARLGLMVNVTGGHINPGWRGHMTLQLVNTGPTSIRITPGLPICQARVALLSSGVDRPYGAASLGSLYMEDDGGPSYWWRDKRVKALYDRLGEKSLEHRAIVAINRLLVDQEPEVVERLDKYADQAPAHVLCNPTALVDSFASGEGRRKKRRTWAINAMRAMVTVPITVSLWIVARPATQPWHYGAWALALCCLLVSLYALSLDVGEHFDERAYRRARERLETAPATEQH